MKAFIGFDPRQPLAYNVLQHSIHRHASGTVMVAPLQLRNLPISRRGLTEFTFSRFLVPWLCGYEGLAAFFDADQVMCGDIAELFAQADGSSAVQVQQEQAKFEWASVMLFDCAKCRILTPQYVDDPHNKLFDFAWAAGAVGKLSPEWNHCVGYAAPADAKLYHYTQGLPCWYETQGLAEDGHWLDAREDMVRTSTWKELMGTSVHAKPVLLRLIDRLKPQISAPALAQSSNAPTREAAPIS